MMADEDMEHQRDLRREIAPEDRRKYLIDGLLMSDPAVEHMYEVDANFKMGLDLFVQMLPDMLRGMAASAWDRQQKMRSEYVLMERLDDDEWVSRLFGPLPKQRP